MNAVPAAFNPKKRISGSALRRQAARFNEIAAHSFADASPDILLVLNAQRQVVFANQRLADLLGLENADCAFGKRPGELFDCIHASESEDGCGATDFCAACGAARAIINGLSGKADVQECQIIQNSTHNPLDLRIYTTPLQVDGQNFTFFSIMDISHEKRRYALERIFFHDILNTVTGLRGMVTMLGRTNSAEELKSIRSDLNHLSEELIEEINDQRQLLAAENNELEARMFPVHSLDILSEVIGAYQPHASASRQRILLAEDVENITFTSDKTLLRRVIGNMLKNALEAAAEGETITLGCRVGGKQVCLWVHNPGEITREVQLQIFQRSFSTKGSSRGLGTYSMKLLGERYLGGQVSFTSDAQRGTVFQIVIPLQAAD
jgi:signal transduction histidine kinase